MYQHEYMESIGVGHRSDVLMSSGLDKFKIENSELLYFDMTWRNVGQKIKSIDYPHLAVDR